MTILSQILLILGLLFIPLIVQFCSYEIFNVDANLGAAIAVMTAIILFAVVGLILFK